ncbi:MAG: hypothetical protein AMJ53_11705 [Gammaproteobacteria bacterium SG8_11]|nr:MAG: hypothetical protein AMJ53_11705 [Gammaproteobacteria bacterium SG8_11]
MTNINSIEVRLGVTDIFRSVDFYSETLGFRLTTLWPSASPQFAILSRDSTRLQLSKSDSDIHSDQSPMCTLWIDVVNVSESYNTIKDKTSIEWGPEVYSYGRREFAFRDPDGYLVILSETTDDPPTCDGL